MSMDGYTNYRLVTYFEMIEWTPDLDMRSYAGREVEEYDEDED